MSLYVFGSNFMGQLGMPQEVDMTSMPQKLEFFNGKRIVKISVAKLHTLVLCEDNALYSWGLNDDYALGRDGEEGFPSLVKFKDNVVDICGGASYSAVLTDKGHVFGCGTFKSSSGVFGFDQANEFQEGFIRIKSLKKIKKIFPGHNHLIMIDESKSIWTVGANESGQLGRTHRERNVKRCLDPFPVSNKSDKSTNQEFVKACGGGFHSMAINELGQCFGWGSNFNGQLGTGNTERSESRQLVGLENVEDVRCGYTHTLFLLKDGSLYGCGDNSMSQLGVVGEKMYSSPVFIMRNVDMVRSGSDFSVAKAGNRLFSWGSNINGELGVDANEAREINVPREVNFDFGNIVDFGCGADFTVVWTED